MHMLFFGMYIHRDFFLYLVMKYLLFIDTHIKSSGCHLAHMEWQHYDQLTDFMKLKGETESSDVKLIQHFLDDGNDLFSALNWTQQSLHEWK